MENTQAPTTSINQQNEPNLREQIAIYSRHWPWFVIGVVFCTLIAYTYLRYATPFYQSKTSIIIKDSKGRGAASELAAFEDLGLISGMNTNSIENEIEILRSKRLLTSVAEALNLHIRYFKEGNIKISEMYDSRPLTVKVFQRDTTAELPNYPLEFTVKEKNTIQITDPETKETIKAGFGEKIQLPFAEITILPNQRIFETTKEDEDIKILIEFADIESVVNYYQKAVQINPVDKNSSVIELTLNDPVKDKAEHILDELIVQYNKDAIDDRNLVAKNTASFIEERLEIITKELDSVETDKVFFKQENKLTDIEAEAQLFLENASELNKDQVEIATKLELVKNVISYLSDEEEIALLPANLGISEEGLDGLIQNYNELVLERNRMLRSSTDENPIIINLTYQIEQLRINVLESLNNVKESLETGLRDLNRQEQIFSSKISQVPGKEKEFRGIERQQSIKEALYLFLLQKREETSISLAVTAPKAKIVDSAHTSKNPVSPKRNIVLLAAILLGLLIPFLVIYLHQLLYDKVKNRKDVERYAPSIPILGEVPKINSKETDVIQENDRSILAESFRILRTNLQYLFANKTNIDEGKTIFVTSTVKGEGKTFAALNLAITLANVGKRIVLVGADIRNPQLHRYFPDSKTKKGVTDYLISDTLTTKDLINPTKFRNNFEVLFSGSIPPNPAELLLNSRVEKMFAELKASYDYIIVDTAPSMLVTDTFLIEKYADVTLYVVRADYTENRLLEFPMDSLAENKLHNVAFVLNNVKMANFGYGNKYGYSYGVEKKTLWQKIKDKLQR